MAAVAREADVAAGAPHLSSKKLSRPFGDDPGEITTWRARQGRALHDSCDILHVTRINAGPHVPERQLRRAVDGAVRFPELAIG